MKISPDITRASLLASKIVLPASAAANVGNNPAAPTIAAITESTFGNVATSINAFAPDKIRKFAIGEFSILVLNSVAFCSSTITTTSGECAKHCS